MNSRGDLEPAGGDGTVQAVQPKRWYERWHVWLLVLAVLAGGFLAEPKVRSRFNRWAEMRKIDRAAASFKKGDYAKAILDARGALESNPANLEANRIIAKSLEALDFPAALTWRIRLEGLLPNDPENSMALAKDALDVGDRDRAARAIKNLKPQDQNTAVFHDVSARLAMSRRDVVSAEADWEQACQLEPKDDRYRLSLATLRLTSKKPGARAAAIEILREIARGSKHAVHALRTLLADAMLQTESARLNEFALSLGGGAATTVGQSADLYTLRELYLDRARAESADVREFADALVAAPGSTFDDKISRLSALREMKDPEASSYLEELRNAAVSNPDHIWRLVTWMNNNTLALLASDWVATLPADIVSKPPVCVAVADTYTKIPDWSKLRQAVEKGSWQEFDYMRRAFFARSLERLGEPDQGAAVWKEAVSAARGRTDTHARLDQLARLAKSWGWEGRSEDVLWELSNFSQCPRWALDALWTIVLSAGDTAKMQKVAGLIAKADPGGVTPRNNYTFLSLLLRTEEGNPHPAAENLHTENPANPVVATTYALSLFQQGKTGKALAVMSALKPEDLRSPLAAFYYGVFLIADGRADEAVEYVQIGLKRSLLPEEQAILARVKEAAAKQAELRRDDPGTAGGTKQLSRP